MAGDTFSETGGGMTPASVPTADDAARAIAAPGTLVLTMERLADYLKSPRPYLMVVGFGLMFGFWYFSVQVWKLPRFKQMPGITDVVREWISANPKYGISLFTADYYWDTWASCRRILIAFFIACGTGIPLGLLLGWSRWCRAAIFPLFEILRPIPVIAWIPIAILLLPGRETPVIFLTAMSSFFATTLNTMLGVSSIDTAYVRAARCLGAGKVAIFRHVVIPGALPCIFTGLQIAMGCAWFSLVVAEIVAGTYGLGYRINTAYVLVAYPTMVIDMLTLGAVGYVSSALVRMAATVLMRWRARELGL